MAAAADTTAAVDASSPPHLPPTQDSPSSVSSPLTEVEDKDGDPDDMDLDDPTHHSSDGDNNDDDDDDDSSSHVPPSHADTDNDDESALSEIEPDVNDSEAETERLYDTPTKVKTIKNVTEGGESSPETMASPTRRVVQTRSDRAFQASPSKLKQQLRVESDAEDADADDAGDEALSVAQDEENNEADGEEEAVADKQRSAAAANRSRRRPSAKDQMATKRALRGQSPSATANSKGEATPAAAAEESETEKKNGTPPAPAPTLLRSQRSFNSADSRKRKRSPTTDPSESDQPLRKRLGSSGGDGSGTAARVASTTPAAAKENDKDKESSGKDGKDNKKTTSKRLNGSGTSKGSDDRTADVANGEIPNEPADNSTEGAASDASRTRRSKRGNASKRNGDSDGDREANDATETIDAKDEANEPNEDAAEDVEGATAEDDAAGPGEDEPMDGDIDEEAEAALRNEEELERKRAALENLQAIERQFAAFRDKLYQERLDQLNQEEAMLAGDNPTHPEYLAMMQCVDERRDEKLGVIDAEYQFNMQTLKRWAVARRSQIHGQYFQSVRESRELVLEELGRQWYEIQQLRRQHANTIPDFGLRFPESKAQRTKDAISYNTEVSILSGIAKYEGFPAAPQIKGASSGQVDDDLEAIARGRQVAAPSALLSMEQTALQQQQQQLQLQQQLQQQPSQQMQPPQQMPPPQHIPPPLSGAAPYREPAGVYSNAGNGNAGTYITGSGSNGTGVSFHSLGAAGQQFLAETPWANPQHPAHPNRLPPPSSAYQHPHHAHLQQQQQQQRQQDWQHMSGPLLHGAPQPPADPQQHQQQHQPLSHDPWPSALPTTAAAANGARKPFPPLPVSSSNDSHHQAPPRRHVPAAPSKASEHYRAVAVADRY